MVQDLVKIIIESSTLVALCFTIQDITLIPLKFSVNRSLVSKFDLSSLVKHPLLKSHRQFP